MSNCNLAATPVESGLNLMKDGNKDVVNVGESWYKL